MKVWTCLARTALTVALSAGSARGDDAMAPPPGAAAPMPATRIWLDLQRSGSLAAGPVRIPATEADRAYRAFLDTYDHPIPQFYVSGKSESSSGR